VHTHAQRAQIEEADDGERERKKGPYTAGIALQEVFQFKHDAHDAHAKMCYRVRLMKWCSGVAMEMDNPFSSLPFSTPPLPSHSCPAVPSWGPLSP